MLDALITQRPAKYSFICSNKFPPFLSPQQEVTSPFPLSQTLQILRAGLYKLRSEAERSWFVYLSVASHAMQNRLQTAKRLRCCTETKMIHDETGQHLNLCCKQQDRNKQQWMSALPQLFSRYLLLLCRRKWFPVECFSAQISSQELCSSPRGAAAAALQIHQSGTNGEGATSKRRLSTRTWHLPRACLSCSAESLSLGEDFAFSKTSDGLYKTGA